MTLQTHGAGQPPESTRQPRSIFNELMILLATWIALVMLAAPQWSPSPVHFVYNASDSVPRGFYTVEPASRLRAGDLVIVRLRNDVAAHAAQRHYLPVGVPLIKHVAALPPQHVCVDASGVRVDGELIASTVAADAAGRTLTAWAGCRQLHDAEVFLLSEHPASFDSRYFGPVSAMQVIGRARPLGGRNGNE